MAARFYSGRPLSLMNTPPSPIPTSVLARLPADARIAVVRTGALGDMVVLTPALRALRAAAPLAHITLLADRAGMLMRRHLPWVDEVIELPPGANDLTRRGEDAVSTFFASMRARHFHVALQCAGGGDSVNPLVLGLGAGLTAGQASRRAPPLDLCMPFQRPLQPESLRLLDIMGLIGVPPGPAHPSVPVLPSDREELAEQAPFDLALLDDPRLIAIHIGSGSGSRRWDPARYAQIIRRLLDTHPSTVALLGTTTESESAARIITHVGPTDRLLDLTGRLSLNALIALLHRIILFIGNDSGPAHLATAVGTPGVIIFGSGHPGTWAPASHLWQRPVADPGAPCRSLGQGCGCPDDSAALCLAAVSVDDVWREILSLLHLLAASPTISSSGMPV